MIGAAPTSAREFFESYLPAWFGKAGGTATSPGALVFHVGPESYALRLEAGVLKVSNAPSTDAVLQVSMSAPDFAQIIKQGDKLFQSGQTDGLLALRSLTLDAERARMIRNVDGSVAFEIVEGETVHTFLLSPGVAVAGAEPPACTVRVESTDFWALSRGEKHPFELLMDGKIRMQGRMEVAMALSSVLVG